MTQFFLVLTHKKKFRPKLLNLKKNVVKHNFLLVLPQ